MYVSVTQLVLCIPSRSILVSAWLEETDSDAHLRQPLTNAREAQNRRGTRGT